MADNLNASVQEKGIYFLTVHTYSIEDVTSTGQRDHLCYLCIQEMNRTNIKSPIYCVFLLCKCDLIYSMTIWNKKKPSKSHIYLYFLSLTLAVIPNSVRRLFYHTFWHCIPNKAIRFVPQYIYSYVNSSPNPMQSPRMYNFQYNSVLDPFKITYQEVW